MAKADDIHENLVSDYLEKGYFDKHFIAFVKICILSNYSLHKVDLGKVYEDLRSGVLSKPYVLLYKMLRHMPDVDEEGENFQLYDDIMDWEGSNPKEYIEKLKPYAVLPDAWKFENGVIKIYEVENSCRLEFNRLDKYSLLQDLLWEHGGVKVKLFEQNASTKLTQEHNISWVFDFVYDFARVNGLTWNDVTHKEALDLYYSCRA